MICSFDELIFLHFHLIGFELTLHNLVHTGEIENLY